MTPGVWGGVPTDGTPTSCQPRPRVRQHPRCQQHQAVTAESVPAHCAQGVPALLCQVRVTNHPPKGQGKGDISFQSPQGWWPCGQAQEQGHEGGGAGAAPSCLGWSMAQGWWWLCPIPHPVPITPGMGSSRELPRCLFFQPLGIFLARDVCSQVVQRGKGQLYGQEPWPMPSSRRGGHQPAPAQIQHPPVLPPGTPQRVAEIPPACRMGHGVNGPVRALARRGMLARAALPTCWLMPRHRLDPAPTAGARRPHPYP